MHAAQVRLYRALLATDDLAAEFTAPDLHAAVAALPGMPAWPGTDEELIARLRGKFTPRADRSDNSDPGCPPDRHPFVAQVTAFTPAGKETGQ